MSRQLISRGAGYDSDRKTVEQEAAARVTVDTIRTLPTEVYQLDPGPLGGIERLQDI